MYFLKNYRKNILLYKRNITIEKKTIISSDWRVVLPSF